MNATVTDVALTPAWVLDQVVAALDSTRCGLLPARFGLEDPPPAEPTWDTEICIAATVDVADSTTGKPTQFGDSRYWTLAELAEGGTAEAAVRTIGAVVAQMMMRLVVHECAETFTVHGVRPVDPHPGGEGTTVLEDAIGFELVPLSDDYVATALAR